MKIFSDHSELRTKDIMQLKGITYSSAANVRALIRKKLGKRKHSVITYAEYKQVYDIKA